MKKKILAATLGLFTSMSLIAPPAVQACAFDMEAYFTWTNHPDLPLNAYAKGDLGVLEGGYARSYLLVAYRYLTGKPLTADEQKGAVDLWNIRLQVQDANCDSDTSKWLAARLTVPGTQKLDQIWTDKPINPDEPWQSFCNCQTPAFTHATATLQSMISKYGATSAQVKEWLKAQDMVFSDCSPNNSKDSSKPVIAVPATLAAGGDANIEHEREYQIASAHFYAGGGNFKLAVEEFDKIAGNANSPYHHIAPYLAARALIREANLTLPPAKGNYAPATERLAKLASDPAYADLHGDIARLQDFIAAKTSPEAHLEAKLKAPITQDNLSETTKMLDNLLEAPPANGNADGGGNDTGDEVGYDKIPPALRHLDEIDWVLTYKSDDKAATAHAVDRWLKTKSLPWLVAAISAIDSNDPHANEIIAAATKEESGPAKWTLFYNVMRLKSDQGKDDEVRAALDKVIDAPPADLPKGSLNLIRTMRLSDARNLGELVKYGVQSPLSVCSNGGTEQVPDDMEQIATKGHGDPTHPMWTPEAGNMIQHRLPLSVLKQLAVAPNVPNDLKNNVAWKSWVRAILIGDDAAAKDLAPLVKQYNAKKGPYIDKYLAATTPEDQKFSAANLMLHFSSATPTPDWGPLSEDGYGDASGWWWSAKPAPTPITLGMEGDTKVDDDEPEFVTAAQKAQVKTQLAKLDKVETAPNWFAHVVLPYAKAHPTDPRVPEALAWLVKATHFGNTDDASKTYSKQAFNILHTQYKTNPWTKKTPYYY